MQRFGVYINVLFTPALTHGAMLTVAGSIVPGSNGTWFANSITHELESLMPGGAWFSSIKCVRLPSGVQL